jgi:signal transduction histidine kinase
MSIRTRWKNISIAKKLYGVIGVMAILIVGELFALWFAMNTLSAVRAFVGGEGLWSKSQKDAAFSLQRYAVTRDEDDYQSFLKHLEVNEGDHISRAELGKEHPDLNIVRKGFLAGRNHPDDVEAMIKLLQRFSSIYYLKQAIVAWAAADTLLYELKEAGVRYHSLLNDKEANAGAIGKVVREIQKINEKMTIQEDKFSDLLGQGARWLEGLVIGLLSLAVLMVESIGLSLAFITTRSISRGLREVTSAASAIGHGDFNRRILVRSSDEIGEVATSINQMGEMLKTSYAELESRVKERTEQLANAVKARDDFLSIASHELRTPLTSLKLQVQVRKRYLKKDDPTYFSKENIEKMVAGDERQISRIVQLVDDMLDISRLSAKKLHLKKEAADLSAIISVVIDRFALNFQNAGCTVTVELSPTLRGEWDHSRIEQVVENLLTNAMKYGSAKPIFVRAWMDTVEQKNFAKFSVRDEGMGIAVEDQTRIFMQFERAVTGYAVTGLGLGLYISNEIVKMHGGTIQLQSTVGKGSTFTVVLPV